MKNPENDLFFLLQDLRWQENGTEMAADFLQSTMVEATAPWLVPLRRLLAQFRDSQQVVSRTGEDEQPLHFLQTS